MKTLHLFFLESHLINIFSIFVPCKAVAGNPLSPCGPHMSLNFTMSERRCKTNKVASFKGQKNKTKQKHGRKQEMAKIIIKKIVSSQRGIEELRKYSKLLLKLKFSMRWVCLKCIEFAKKKNQSYLPSGLLPEKMHFIFYPKQLFHS